MARRTIWPTRCGGFPKLGIEVPAPQRAELEQGLEKLQAAIDLLQQSKDAQRAATAAGRADLSQGGPRCA